MRILLTHRYFWPDSTPYAIILKKIAKRLVEDGHNVTVLSTQPGYNSIAPTQDQAKTEVIDGYRIHRIKLLPSVSWFTKMNGINMFIYFISVISFGLRNRDFDVVMNATSPPILAGVAGRIVSMFSKAKHYYHFMDIHPEIGRISGEFSNPLMFKLLQKVDSYVCSKADRIFVLSEDMKNTLVSRPNCRNIRVSVLQNFDLTDSKELTDSPPTQYRKPDNVFRVIFAGNIGRFQNLEAIVEAFLEADDKQIQLVLLGDGKLKKRLHDRVVDTKSNSVLFFPHQSVEDANKIIRNADMGLISLTPGIYQYAYPTKLISYLSVGCPVIAAIEAGSSLAQFISEREIGLTITPEELPAGIQQIKALATDMGRFSVYSNNASVTYKEFFEEAPVLDKWSEYFS